MPRYSYNCVECGSFEAMRPIAAYAEPCPCPVCGLSAARGLASARIGTRAAPAAAARAPRHRAGCGCCSPALSKTMRAEAVAAAAPRRGPAPSSASFLTRDA